MQSAIEVRKRRSREWDGVVMNTEVFETPDPEVTFHPYAAVQRGAGGVHGNSAFAPEDAHVFDKMSMELDEASVAPTQAFEAFMGKIYKPTRLPTTLTELESLGALPFKSDGLRDLESPLQRFTRLTMEIKELESDLTLLAQTKKPTNADAAVVLDAAQDAEYTEIMQGLATLQLNLSAMEQNTHFQPFLQPANVGGLATTRADAVATLQRDLTAKFFQQIDALKIQQQQQGGVAMAASTQAPIVYEIYSNGELNAVDRDAKSRVLALESKIASLEKILGATNPKELHIDGLRASASASADLSSLVDELDKRVALLNEKNLDAIKTRTTALVHELSLLHKLKESPNVQGALSAQADREKIHQIFDKLNSVEEVAASVPSIVDRLVTLKSVHDESLDLSGRVKKMEQSQRTLQDVLKSDEALLTNIEQSLHENMQIFQANIQTLDDRMNQLLASSTR